MNIEESLDSVSTQLGISRQVAREATKVVLRLADKRLADLGHGDLIRKIPGAQELLQEDPPPAAGQKAGGIALLLGSAGDMAKAFSDLQAAGLQASQVAPFVRAFLQHAREAAGPEVVEDIVSKIPALRSFI